VERFVGAGHGGPLYSTAVSPPSRVGRMRKHVAGEQSQRVDIPPAASAAGPESDGIACER